IALSTARIHRVRGRPPLLAAGIKSLIHSHSSLVRSLGYIFSFIHLFYTTHEDFSDRLLEHALQQERIPFEAVYGFERVVSSHLDVAREVLAGRAEAGISAASIATAFGLGFIPLQQVRYDIVVLKDYLHEPLVEQLLNTPSYQRL